MRGHVDAESLALYAEGQLSRRRTARVRAHLAGCAECARTEAALTEVTTELSHVPVPPMPSAVAARLDAALNAESARRAAAPSAAPAPAGAPEPRPPRRNPLWSPNALRILAATGVTLVVAGGVGYALSQVSGSSGTSSGRSGAAAPAPRIHHGQTIQGGPNLSPGSTGRPHSGPNRSGPSTRYVASGTDYQPGTLATQAQKVLAENVNGGTGPHVVPANNVRTTVRDCVSRTVGSRPVVVDLARYEQQPAIVIMRAATAGIPEMVTVLSHSCHQLAAAGLAVTSGPTTR